MSFDTAITAHFGGDTTDLKESTQEAAIMMKGFSTSASRAVRDIGEGFVGAVVFTEAIKGIKELSEAAMDAAEQERAASEVTGEAISEQGRAWLDLKDGIGGAGGGFKAFATSVISTVPEIGDTIGDIINTIRGISPEAQKQYTQMADDAETSLARIKAAHDKYIADQPAEMQALNSKLLTLQQQYTNETETLQERLDTNLEKQAAIKATMAQQDPKSEAYLRNQVALQEAVNAQVQIEADIQKQAIEDQNRLNEMAVEVSRQTVSDENAKYQAASQTMTAQEKVVALQQLQAQFTNLSKQDEISLAQVEVYENAAKQTGVEISKQKAQIIQQSKLAAADELALYIAQAPALENLNNLSLSQVQVLQLQKKIKSDQAQIDQLLSNGASDLTSAQKDELDTLIQQVAKLKEKLDLTNQAVDAEKQEADQTASVAGNLKTAADQAQRLASIGHGGGHSSNSGGSYDDDDDDGDDDPNDPNAAVDRAQLVADNAKGSSGSNFGGYSTIITQAGVGSGDQQLIEAQSAANAKANIDSEIKNLQSQISGYQFSADPTEEALIPALQQKINTLHQQEINISPTNLNGTAPAGYTSPDNTKILTAQSNTLSDISSKLDKILGG